MNCYRTQRKRKLGILMAQLHSIKAPNMNQAGEGEVQDRSAKVQLDSRGSAKDSRALTSTSKIYLGPSWVVEGVEDPRVNKILFKRRFS